MKKLDVVAIDPSHPILWFCFGNYMYSATAPSQKPLRICATYIGNCGFAHREALSHVCYGSFWRVSQIRAIKEEHPVLFSSLHNFLEGTYLLLKCLSLKSCIIVLEGQLNSNNFLVLYFQFWNFLNPFFCSECWGVNCGMLSSPVFACLPTYNLACCSVVIY